MTSIPDITIIGGGVIGLLTAREFHHAGATVAIFEKKQLGQESSWAGGGILLPLYPWRQKQAISQLVRQSLLLYPTLAAELLADTGLDPEWTQCGMLITKNPDVSAAVDWCHAYGIAFQIPDPCFFNAFCTEPLNPLWLPEIAQARNPRLVKSIRQDLINKGVIIHEHCELLAVKVEQNCITSIQTTSGTQAVNQLVIATGAWTGEVFKELFSSVTHVIPNISPVKGQMLLFDAEPETLRHMILDGDHYLIPRRDGKILAGSTVELDDFRKSTTIEACTKLTEFAIELLPALKCYPMIKHWAGLRPGTESGVPYIDKHPEIKNLSVNAGHFRNGLVMSPASAQLLVDLVLNRPTQVPPAPYQFASEH
jgi:glycine oxidase